MTSKSKRPSATAHIDELHAWAGRANKTSAVEGGTSAQDAPTRLLNVPARGGNRTDTGFDPRGGALVPKVLLVLGGALVVYLVISIIMGLLMTLLMVAGGAALLYGAYRVGRWQGRREGRQAISSER